MKPYYCALCAPLPLLAKAGDFTIDAKLFLEGRDIIEPA
jgi:hypothetical protein